MIRIKNDFRRLSNAANCIACWFAFLCCLAPLQVAAQALPALPFSTPPLTAPSVAANDMQFGRVGNGADAEVGRDRIYRGTTPANDASFTRAGRSRVAVNLASNAALNFIKKMGPLATGMAVLELAKDIQGAYWGINGFPGPIENAMFQPGSGKYYTARAPNGQRVEGVTPMSLFDPIKAACSDQFTVCEMVGFTETGDTGHLSFCGAYGCSGFPVSILTVPVVGHDVLVPDQKIMDAMKLSPKFAQMLAELYANPVPAGCNICDIPWSPEVVILPDQIKLAPKIEQLPDGSIRTTNTNLVPRSTAEGPIVWDRQDAVVTVQPPNTQSNPSANTVTIAQGTTTAPITPEKDFCQLHPNTIGCIDLDTPSEVIPKVTKNISYSPENIFGGGSCPADKIVNIRGQQLKVWDWADTCSKLVSYVRPLMIAIAGFMALLIVAGVRTES